MAAPKRRTKLMCKQLGATEDMRATWRTRGWMSPVSGKPAPTASANGALVRQRVWVGSELVEVDALPRHGSKEVDSGANAEAGNSRSKPPPSAVVGLHRSMPRALLDV